MTYQPALLFFTLMAFSSLCTAQTICPVLTGTINDEKNVPVSGAHIYNKTKKTGSISDEKGIFQIDVSPGDTLAISFVGYEQKIIRLLGLSLCDTLKVIFREGSIVLPEVTVYSLHENFLARPKREPYKLEGINSQPQNIHKYDKPVVKLWPTNKQDANEAYKRSSDSTRAPVLGPDITITGALTALQNKLSKETKQKKILSKEPSANYYYTIVTDTVFEERFEKHYHIRKDTYQEYVGYFKINFYDQKDYPSDYYLVEDFYEAFKEFLNNWRDK